MCRRDSYSDTHCTSKATCFSPRPTSNTAPGLSAAALVTSSYLLVFFILLLICLPQDAKQHILILMCVDFIHLISHMALEYKQTPVSLQEANHIHIIVSHGMKKKKKKGLGKQIAINVHRNADTNTLVCKAPFVAFVRLGGGPLKKAKQWHNDIEKRGIVYRMKEERGEKRLHPYSISGTGPQ